MMEYKCSVYKAKAAQKETFTLNLSLESLQFCSPLTCASTTKSSAFCESRVKAEYYIDVKEKKEKSTELC